MKKIFFLSGVLISLSLSFVVLAKNSEKNPKLLKLNWSQSLSGPPSRKAYASEAASPNVEGALVFVGTHSGNFYALDSSKKGKVVWEFDAEEPIASQALIKEGRVYFGTNKGKMFSLDSGTGQKQWDYFVGGEILTQPVVAGQTIYGVTTSREVFALDLQTGKDRFISYVRGYEKRITVRGNSSIIFHNGRLYVGFADGQVVCLSSADGKVIWSQNLSNFSNPFLDVDASLLADGNVVYATGYADQTVKLDASSGRVLWKQDLGSGVNMLLSSGRLWLSTTDGHLVALNSSTGTRDKDYPLATSALSSPVLLGDRVVAVTKEGEMQVVRASDGLFLSRFNIPGGTLSSPVVSQNQLYFLSTRTRLMAFSPNGTL